MNRYELLKVDMGYLSHHTNYLEADVAIVVTLISGKGYAFILDGQFTCRHMVESFKYDLQQMSKFL